MHASGALKVRSGGYLYLGSHGGERRRVNPWVLDTPPGTLIGAGSCGALAIVRGKKVSAEINVPKELLQRRMHTTPAEMERYWKTSAIGAIQSGSIGIQGHFANALAALYIACGQDPACVAESAVGVTRMEVNEHGDLYISVTLRSVMVGTLGGGTSLPTQRACLEILGLSGAGKARALAEVCAALALAGEISLTSAICASHFARAHQKLARGNHDGQRPKNG